jgi:transcriptional regulator with XRE-family HTH domain
MVKHLRQRRKMTQAQLAEKAGIHRIYVAHIEAATKTPSLAMLERLAKALGVKVGKLLD